MNLADPACPENGKRWTWTPVRTDLTVRCSTTGRQVQTIEWGCGGLEADTAHRQPLLGCDRAFRTAIAKHVIAEPRGAASISVASSQRQPQSAGAAHIGTGLMQFHVHDQGKTAQWIWFSRTVAITSAWWFWFGVHVIIALALMASRYSEARQRLVDHGDPASMLQELRYGVGSRSCMIWKPRRPVHLSVPDQRHAVGPSLCLSAYPEWTVEFYLSMGLLGLYIIIRKMITGQTAWWDTKSAWLKRPSRSISAWVSSRHWSLRWSCRWLGRQNPWQQTRSLKIRLKRLFLARGRAKRCLATRGLWKDLKIFYYATVIYAYINQVCYKVCNDFLKWSSV